MFTILKEHRGFGKQILLLAKNELIKTYKGAVIGPLWAVVKPAFTIFVYWFAFSCGIKQLKTLHLDIGAVDHVSARKKININGQYRKNCRLYQLGPIVKSTYAYINAIRIRYFLVIGYYVQLLRL